MQSTISNVRTQIPITICLATIADPVLRAEPRCPGNIAESFRTEFQDEITPSSNPSFRPKTADNDCASAIVADQVRKDRRIKWPAGERVRAASWARAFAESAVDGPPSLVHE
jgi:hypothetical protein